MSKVFDFVIIGGGSAGCVLANRLSANPSYSVALLEAGGRDDWIWFHIPVGYLFAIGNARADWLYSTEAIPGLNGRTLAYPRGKVIGGSSAINAMIYMRGQVQDYDNWRQLGLVGWGWNDVLPIFRKQEDNWRGDTQVHGTGGEWRVDRPRVRWAILDAFMLAAEQAGIPRTEDFNAGDNEGCGYFDVNQKRGERWSAARGFLRPISNRPNLAVFTNTEVDHVEIANGRAVGVLVTAPGGHGERIEARGEVILSAGSIGSPVILERSGLGNGERLRRLGIATVRNLPGVGENLQDHLQLRPIFKVANATTLNTHYRSLLRRGLMAAEYFALRRGAMTMAPSQLGAFTRSSPRYETPNIQMHIQPLSLEKFGENLHAFPAITTSVCNLRPNSRGWVHAQSADVTQPPSIAPNYLADAEDREVAAQSIRVVRNIMSQPAMTAFNPEEYRPGAELDSDAELMAAAREIGTTIFHPVGTAKMGVESDTMAVVGADLKVKGVFGLRVADASIMPTIVSGNTNSPTMMIAEKAAEMVLATARAL